MSQLPPNQQGPYSQDPNQMTGDATGGLIPYKNGPALLSYYLGVFSIVIPPLAIVSIILGVVGLKKRKQNPVIKGAGHAIVGIVLGSFITLIWLGVIVVIIIGVINSA